MRTTGDTLYTGQTNNINRRVKEHVEKERRASKYIKRFLSSKLVYYEVYTTRKETMRRELEIKKLSHNEKEALIENSGITLAELEAAV
jgi:putative endonuclease